MHTSASNEVPLRAQSIPQSRRRTKSTKLHHTVLRTEFHKTCLLPTKRDLFGEPSRKRPDKLEAAVSSSGGVITSRCIDHLKKLEIISFESRVRHEIKLETLPEFADFPDWIKPIVYQQHQVTSYHDVVQCRCKDLT